MNKRPAVSNWLIGVVLLIGLIILSAGLFANLIGIDPNNGWGLRRIAMLEVGYLIVVITTALLLNRVSRKKTMNGVIFCVVLQCLLVYFWYETAGTMKLITTTHYYDMQAQAYLHGQLELLQTPDPELLKLPDPYDPVQNSAFRLHDALLYKGNYYFYWGPIPALFLAVMKLVTGQTFSDSFLVLLFMSGYILFLALVMMELRRKHFPDSPIWILVLGVLFGGLMNPALWLLARPAIYEAAISGGQFFFLAGIFFALTAFKKDEDISTGKLVLSGAFLACSVLSRISLVLAVFWAAAFVEYTILKRLGLLKRFLRPALAFSIPLILGATMLFIYNTLRFGSPFEIGTKYALTGIKQTKYIENGSFHSAQYILPNLNTYFFYPIQKIPTFPFVVAPWNGNWIPDLVDATLNSPNRYMLVEPVAGMTNTSPLLWLILVPILFNLSKTHYTQLTQKMPNNEKNLGDTTWDFHLFTGLALFAFLPVSLEFTATMRYIFDFNSSWYILAYLGFMYGYTQFGKTAKRILVVFYLTLGAITILNGILLGVTGYSENFLRINPGLFEILVKFLSFFHNP